MEDELDEATRFLLALTEHMDSTFPSSLAIAPLLRKSLNEQTRLSLSTRVKGARMAVRDLLEATGDLTPDQLKAADGALTARSVVTLSDMRERHWKLVPKILARGRIRNEEEYRLVLVRLNDVSSSGCQGEERERASQMAVAYEETRRRRRK